MNKTGFIVKNNLSAPFLVLYITILVLVLFRVPFIASLSLLLFFHQLITLVLSMGAVIPVRALIGTFFCLQLLIGPLIAYNGGDEYLIDAYKMKVDEATYFSLLLPATLAFLIGLNLKSKRSEGELLDIGAIRQVKLTHPKIAQALIIVGFATMILESFVSSDLKFVVYVIGLFRFIGVFLAILVNRKFPFIETVLVYGYLLLVSIQSGMFHDLLTWSVFLFAIIMLRYKPGNLLKSVILTGFLIAAIFIQFIKQDYRQTLYEGTEAGVDVVTDVYTNATLEKGSMFSKANLYENAVRINQGYIVSNVMNNVPANIPFSEGESMKQIFMSSIFPRFIYPDKLNAGDREFFMHYTGMKIAEGTSMGISSVGDAYANFGKNGSWIFMLFYGLLFNLGLRLLHKRSAVTPLILVFSPVIFIYPIRPDCEMQTILGHFFKATILVLIMFQLYKRKLSFDLPIISKKIRTPQG